MPKAILEFNLPEEDTEHRRACDGMSLWCAADSFRAELRCKDKYSELSPDQRALLDELTTAFFAEFEGLLE